MKHRLALSLALCIVAGCDGDTRMLDSGAPGSDAGANTDAGSTDDAGVDGGPADPASRLEALREREIGAVDPTVLLDGVVVTYVRTGELGDDPPGFFVQAGPQGPAAYVTVAPDNLHPAPVAGDTVSFRVARIERVSEQTRIVAVEDWSRRAQGFALSGYEQDLSAAVDADEVDRYESEWVVASGTLVGDAASGGPGYQRIRFRTSVVDSERVSVRVLDSVLTGTPVSDGCDVRVGPSPVWRFQDTTQIMVLEPAHLSVVSCPAPTVLSAATVSPTQVAVTFSRALEATTVMASDFMFVGGDTPLTAGSVVVDGAVATVTTAQPMQDGADYTVIVSDVVDVTGTMLGSSNSATFLGLGEGSPSLLFTECVEGSGMNHALEISNLGEVGLQLDRCAIHLHPNGVAGPRYTLPAVRLGAGETFVVCHPASTLETRDRCDLLNTTPTVFNGDDAIELLCDGAVVDVIGQVGFDPGTSWSSGVVSTANQTIRRNCGISVGDRDSSDAFDVGLEWSAAPLDDVSDLGTHCE